MRATLFILLWVYGVTTSSGQQFALGSKLIEGNVGNLTTTQRDSLYFSLTPLSTTPFKTHIRVSFDEKYVDLQSKDDINYYGFVTFYIPEEIAANDRNGDYKYSKAVRYFYQKVPISSEVARQIVQHIFSTGQHKVPTDSQITEWHRTWLHCASLIFEFNLNKNYQKQIFHCPWRQNENVTHLKTVLANYNYVKEKLRIDSLYEVFVELLPKGRLYTRYGYMGMYKMTDLELESWKETEPMREYLKSVRDTIDKSLELHLSLLTLDPREYNCFDEFEILFGTNGKLRRVFVNEPKLSSSGYFHDMREIRKCKKALRHVFRSIDLGFLNLRYGFYRSVTLNIEGEIQIRDNTIY